MTKRASHTYSLILALVAAGLHCLAVQPARSQATWSNVDLWTKWPSNAAPGSPADDGYWGPVITMTQPWQLLNVHAALLYDGSHAKLTMFRNDMIVYDLDGSPGSQTLLDLNGLNSPPVLTPNGHEVFCAGYVPMADGRLLIVGGPLGHDWGPDTAPEECNGVPVTTGWASIVDPANICAPGNLNVNCWIPAGNLADSTGSWTQSNLPCDTAGYGPRVFSTARYYPTCTRLDDGRVLVTAGDFWTDCTQDDCLDGQEPQEYSLQPIWALYDAGAPSGSRWT